MGGTLAQFTTHANPSYKNVIVPPRHTQIKYRVRRSRSI